MSKKITSNIRPVTFSFSLFDLILFFSSRHVSSSWESLISWRFASINVILEAGVSGNSATRRRCHFCCVL